MLDRWDGVVLDRIEQRCHTIQRWCGLTNFDIARTTFTGSMAMISLMFLVMPPQPEWKMALAVGAAALMYLKIFSDWYAQMEEHYQKAPGTAHWRTLVWREQSGARIFAALLMVGATGASLMRVGASPLGLGIVAIAMLLRLASLYLQCVIPLPPGKSTVHQWADDIRAGFKKPVPIPTRR